MTGLQGVLFREYKLLVRSRVTLALGLAPPILYLLLFATSITNVVPVVQYRGGVVPYALFIAPAIMVMSMLSAASAAATSVFQEERGGMLIELWSYPLRKEAYLAGKLIAAAVLILTQGSLLVAAAAALFHGNWLLIHPGAVVIAALVTSLCLTGIYLFSATIFQDHQSFMIFINICSPILIFTSPSFYPQKQMPALLEAISHVNPVTYGMTAVRDSLLYGLSSAWSSDMVLVGIAAVSIVAASARLLQRFSDL